MHDTERVDTGGAPSRTSRIAQIALAASTLAAGLLLLGAAFGSTSASADEQPSGGSLLGTLTSTVSSAATSTVSTLSSAASSLAPAAVPQVVESTPVESPVAASPAAASPAAASPAQPANSAPTTAPVAAVVGSVAAIATNLTDAVAGEPVAGILHAPIVGTATNAVDGLLGQLPVVSTIVGDAALNGILTPISTTLDGALGLVAGTVAPVVGALGPVVEELPALLPPQDRPATTTPDPVAPLITSATDLATVASSGSQSPGGQSAPKSLSANSAVLPTLWIAASSSPPGGQRLPGTPNPSTPAAPATSSTSGSSAGGAVGAVASLSDSGWHPLAVAGGTSGTHNDTLPPAPTFESDESPD
ncbi:MAG: hypothetical protein ABI255_08860 [Microbacteriaceae bacterium]